VGNGAKTAEAIGYRQILNRAWPIILANSAVPLLGLVDTAVIGNTGSAVELGAIALGSLVFNFIYWSFGFLRMGTTGFVAQSDGRDDHLEVRAAFARALLLACGIGVLLVLFRWPITVISMQLLGGGEAVESVGETYLLLRIFGAPATLAMFVMLGVLVGLGESGALLRVQLVLNGINIALDLYFAGVLKMGARGIAIGTAIAEWIAVGYAALTVLYLLRTHQAPGEPFWDADRIFQRHAFLQTLRANSDIMIRSLFLLFSFGWFTDRSARFGDTVLAANHILLQFVTFCAFFLDGFAFVTEALAGNAIGKGERNRFVQVVARSTLLAGITAICLSGILLLFHPALISFLTTIPEVRELCERYVGYAVVYIAVSFAAFQFDGIFIGTSQTKQMRDASIVSTLVFLAAGFVLTAHWGNDGLWSAFIVFLVTRAVTLLRHYPGLVKGIA